MDDHADWKDLIGRQVQVLKDGRIIRSGYVEAATFTGDALWIGAYGTEPRALYEKLQGHLVLPVPGQDQLARQ